MEMRFFSLIVFFSILANLALGLSANNWDWTSATDRTSTPCTSSSPDEIVSVVSEHPWIQASLDEGLVLRCHICHNHQDRLVQTWWSREGERLHRKAGQRRLLQQTIAEGHEVTSLQLFRVQSSDLGKYTCHALMASAKEVLNETVVSAVPYPARLFAPMQQAATAFELSWRVRSVTPIIHFLLEFRATDANSDLVWLQIVVPNNENAEQNALDDGVVSQSYLLRGLATNVVYEARVRSRNAFGLSGQSNVVVFRTSEDERSDQRKRGAQQLQQQHEVDDLAQNKEDDDEKEEKQEQEQKAEQEALNKAEKANLMDISLILAMLSCVRYY